VLHRDAEEVEVLRGDATAGVGADHVVVSFLLRVSCDRGVLRER
jgi:hypothetical protein